MYGLTPREEEVWKLLSEGYDNQVIANKLSITIKAIDQHCRLIYDKIRVENDFTGRNPRVYVANLYWKRG